MQSTLEGFDPIRAEPNGFPFHFLSHTDNVSYYEMPCVAARATLHGWRHRDPAFTFRHQAVPWKFCRILHWHGWQHTAPLRGSSVKIGTIQRRLAWPLRKDDTHKSRSVNILLSALGPHATPHGLAHLQVRRDPQAGAVCREPKVLHWKGTTQICMACSQGRQAPI